MRYKEALERFKRSKVTNRDIGRRNKWSYTPGKEVNNSISGVLYFQIDVDV
jgi:hypothetical protein